MRLAHLLSLSLLAFPVAQVPVFADVSAQTLADLKSTDPGTRASALRLRGLDYEKQGRFEDAKNDYIACLEDTRKTTNQGREAEMFARVAYCQVRLGAFDDALANMEKAPRQDGWIENEKFFLRNRAIVYLATDQHQKALDIATRLKASEDDAAKALGQHFEAAARFLMGDEASLSLGMGSQLYDPGQLPFNRAIFLDPKSREARVKRARYFAERANQKRFPDYYPPTVPTTKGGWMNIIDSGVLDVQPHTFYQSAYFDWGRAIDLEKRPADYAERALMGAQWNEVATRDSDKIAPSLIRNDISVAENRRAHDPETMRALGRYYENTLPKSDAPEFRPALRQAISNYSLALMYAPDAPESQSVRETRNNLIGMFLSGKPVAPPPVRPTTAEAWKARGNELSAKNELAASLEAFEKALEVDPKYADAMNNIGSLYSKVGAYDVALDWFGKAIVADPKHRIAYYNRASINNDLDENERALVDAMPAVQFAVTPAQKWEALNLRSNINYLLGHPDKSFADNAEAIKIDPAQAQLWAMKGQLELETGSLDAATASLEKSKQLESRNGRVVALLLTAKLLRNGDVPAAGDLTARDKRWLTFFLKKPKLDELYGKSPQKERLEQARKLASAQD